MPHVLIIDREVSNPHPLTDAMARQGFATSVLQEGADALAWAREHRPDAIVLSVELPAVSGYAICNRLKKDEALRSIPLLLASSEATPEVFEEHRRLKTHADAYLHKPYNIDRVLQALQQAMGQTTVQEQASAREPASRGRGTVPAASSRGRDDEDGEHHKDPLMSTDALLLLEGSVDVNKHTQVIRLPMGAQTEQAKDLIGKALADLDTDAMAALTALEGRVQELEDALRGQASLLADQRALMTQLTEALARAEARQAESAHHLARALQQSLQLCREALGDGQRFA